jgi:hypothetical protein
MPPALDMPTLAEHRPSKPETTTAVGGDLGAAFDATNKRSLLFEDLTAS